MLSPLETCCWGAIVGVRVAVGLGVGVGVAVAVGLGVAVGASVEVGCGAGVEVGMRVAVGVCVVSSPLQASSATVTKIKAPNRSFDIFYLLPKFPCQVGYNTRLPAKHNRRAGKWSFIKRSRHCSPDAPARAMAL